MNIIVTGGLGFIGSALIRYLISKTKNNVLNIDAITKISMPEALKGYDNSFIRKNMHHLCASYQEAIIDTLLIRISMISREHNIANISIAGGVAANKRFRYKSSVLAEKNNINIFFPDMRLCTDNAGMIAIAGHEKLSNGHVSAFDLEANPNLSL